MKTKPRNPIVRDQITNPKRNAGKHKPRSDKANPYVFDPNEQDLNECIFVESDRHQPGLSKAVGNA